jgi:hypothetical protein
VRTEIKEATQKVHWPGQDTAACDEHAEKLIALGRWMGFEVTSTPIAYTPCINCENEAKGYDR